MYICMYHQPSLSIPPLSELLIIFMSVSWRRIKIRDLFSEHSVELEGKVEDFLVRPYVYPFLNLEDAACVLSPLC